MDNNYNGSSYFLEIHDRISSMDIVLRGNTDPHILEVHPHFITAKSRNGKENTYSLPLAVDPASVSCVKKHLNEGVGLRFQIRDVNNKLDTGIMSTSVKLYCEEIDQMKQGPCQSICKTCGLSLFADDIKFNRILPLPSQTWRDLFNNWSCCSHKNGTKGHKTINFPTAPLRPRESDCLLSDLYIMVHSKVVEKKNIVISRSVDKTSINVKCIRCRSIVGEALAYAVSKDLNKRTTTKQSEEKLGAFKFFKNSIEVFALKSNISDTIVRPIFFSDFFLERILAQQFSTAVETHITYMFLIKDPQKKVHLLVKVLNASTRLYINNDNLENQTNTADVNSVVQPNMHCKTKTISSKDSAATDDFNTTNLDNCPDTNLKLKNNCMPPVNGSDKLSDGIEKLFSFSTHLISIGRACNGTHTTDPNKCERIVKVLYASTANPVIKDLAVKWEKDERTLTLTYPMHICVQMHLVLISSTLTMPVAHRVMDDFVLGFLRLD